MSHPLLGTAVRAAELDALLREAHIMGESDGERAAAFRDAYGHAADAPGTYRGRVAAEFATYLHAGREWRLDGDRDWVLAQLETHAPSWYLAGFEAGEERHAAAESVCGDHDTESSGCCDRCGQWGTEPDARDALPFA